MSKTLLFNVRITLDTDYFIGVTLSNNLTSQRPCFQAAASNFPKGTSSNCQLSIVLRISYM